MKKPTEITSTELRGKINALLDEGEAIDCKLGVRGELHIDRQLPYLCVHRQALDDRDTRKLLHGQAAYLVADIDMEIVEVIHTIARSQGERFGNFMILEIWLGDRPAASGTHPPTPSFHIHAPTKNAPHDVLDVFVNALQEITLRNRAADVKLSYDDNHTSPGLQPLLSKELASELDCTLIGLEVTPVYQDESGSTLPFALQGIQRSLTRALRKALFSFSRLQTHHRPLHFQELGSRALNQWTWNADQRLAQISESFDLLVHVTPINAAQAWSDFENSGLQKTPEFHYRPRSANPSLLKRELYEIPLERVDDPAIADLFNAKRIELDRQITLLSDRNSEAFLHGSIQLFGKVDETLLDTAAMLISSTGQDSSGSIEKLNPQQLARAANSELDYYRKSDSSLSARVEVRNDITGIMVSHGNFFIGSDSHVSKARLGATLHHEIGTHALTYHNGKKQPLKLLYAGMAGYEELQESLAVLAEYLSNGLSLPRLQLLAGRVVAVHHICNGADFVECFRSLHCEYGFRPFTAFNMTMRVYRGGGYTKDLIYLRGFLRLLDQLADELDVELLFCGKVAMEHLDLMRELRWRHVLKPLVLTPRYLSDSAARERLKALVAEPSIESVLGNL